MITIILMYYFVFEVIYLYNYYKSNIFSYWFCLTNHKIIGVLYLFFGIWVAFLATLMSILIRREYFTSCHHLGFICIIWYWQFIVWIFVYILKYTNVSTYRKSIYGLCDMYNR